MVSDEPAPADGRELRDQGRRTMTALLDAGMSVLADKGLHGARIDDVVETAGVSHGTFYLYFSNKDDLVRAMAERCAVETEHLAAALPPVDSGPDGREVLRAWLPEFFALYREHGAVIRAWTEQQMADHRLVDLGRSAFGHITASLVRRLPTVPGGRRANELRAIALLAMIERFAYVWTSRDLGWPDDRMYDTLAGLVHRAFFQAGSAAASPVR